MLKKSLILQQQATTFEVAAQVAHDIRSPLAALSMIEPELSVLPEDSRVILRHAISRIRDIANQLLGQSKSTQSKDQDERTRVLLPSVLDAILSEKRVNYRDRSAIEIEGQIDPSTYGIFAEVQPLEFGRIISNLINNSVEAMDGQGRIEVALSLQESEAVIVIKDNGKGIPAEVLKKLGQRGVTHGKAGGSGLGLYHARSKVEEWGGKLVMTSEVGRGTQVTIRLPKVGTPQWFVSQIKLKSLQTVVILDDDSSIHEVWKKRFGSQALGGKSIHLVHCSTPLELRQFVASNKISPILYLCDYELLGSKETGLDLIQECGIQNQAILVTSRFEESSLRQRCEGLEVRLIPKSLATLVPISVS
jgi:two-component sensor histidine kinase